MTVSTADAFTRQVIQSYLLSTVKEMMRTTKASAYSTIFTEGEDFTCAITDADGRLVYQAEGLALQGACFPAAVESAVADFETFEPGDIVFLNDPYRAGTHQADGAFVLPVFWEGELLFFAGNRGHWADIGGMAAGGWAGSAQHVVQEALFVPPIKLYKGGRLDIELKRLLLANVRNANEAWGTVQAQVASLLTAEERIHAVLRRYGVEAVKEATEAYLEYGRARFLAGLRELPDGEWSAEECMEDDGTRGGGPFPIKVKIVKRGDKISVDLAGTAPQARGPANMSLSATKTSVLVALMSVIDPDLPLNSGWFDLVDVTAPLGSIANPTYPAPMFHGTGAPMIRVNEAMLRALAQAVPERVTAASFGSGMAFMLYFRSAGAGERIWMNYIGGGCGARATHDGLDGHWWTLCNCKNEPTEIIENRFPMRMERMGWYRASGGAGKHRGGLGIEREIVLLEDGTASALNDRHIVEPWGLQGGGAGRPTRHHVVRDGGSISFVEAFGTASPSKFDNVHLRAGERLLISSGGGGGYGDPAERDPKALREDVENGYLTEEDVRRDYGVDLGAP